METVPPFSWHEVATKRDLAELEGRLNERFDQLERGVDGRIDERTNLLRAEAGSSSRRRSPSSVASW